MSSEDSTRGHLAQYLNDAENLIHIIMYDDFDKQIDLLKKYGPSTKEYVRQIAATVQHIRQLQFLCISSSWSKTEKNHVCHYLNEQKRKESMETAIKYFFEQFGQRDRLPPEIIVELYRLFAIVNDHCRKSSPTKDEGPNAGKSEDFPDSHPLNKDNMRNNLRAYVDIWKNAFESSGRNKVQRALGNLYHELAKFVEDDTIKKDIENTLDPSGQA